MDLEKFRKELVGPTARLVEFLRDLVRAGTSSIRAVDGYEDFRWVHDLPAPAKHTLDTAAGPGEIVFSLDYLPAEPPPEVPQSLREWLAADQVNDSSHPGPTLEHPAPPRELLTEYERWLDAWRIWAEADLRDRPRREWYEFLAATGRQLDQHDDEVELVVGCGVVSWASPIGDIRHPLLTFRLGVATDVDTGRIDVFVADDATTRVNDRQLFEGIDTFQPARVQQLREEWRAVPVIPLSDEHKERFLRWSEQALARCRPYQHVWEPATELPGSPEIRFSPVLIFRKRDRTNLVDYYERILEALSGPDALAPLGLAQLLGAIEPEQRMAWLEAEGAISGEVLGSDPLMPLPANPEQRQIIVRLRHENGVVVQGPPGTGKTHTIAYLLAALLARGQRVLVTSQKAQALRVLRDQLPEPIQELCVSMTDVGRGGSRELDRGVSALSDNYANFNEAAHAEKVARLESERRAAQQHVASVKEELRRLRENETILHPRIAPGYEGKIGRITEALLKNEARDGWIPVPFPDAAPTDPPLTQQELMELRELLIEATPEREARRDQVLVPVASLPVPQQVREMVEAERAAKDVAATAETPASRALAARSRTDLELLRGLFEEVNGALAKLHLDAVVRDWPGDEWFVVALHDAFANREFAVWERFAPRAREAANAQAMLAEMGLQDVVLPQFDESGPGSLAAQLAAGRKLQAHLAAGNRLRRFFPPTMQRDAERLVEEAMVDGRTIMQDPSILPAILNVLDAVHIAAALRAQWNDRGVDLDPALPLERRVARLVDLADQLEAVLAVKDARDRFERTVLSWSIRLPVNTPHDWFECAELVNAAELEHRAAEASRVLADAVGEIEHLARASSAPPELYALARAVYARDPDEYTEILDRYSRAELEKQRQLRCDELLKRLQTAHPVLAQKFVDDPVDERWLARFATFGEAWSWGLARTYVDRLRQPGRDARLAEELDGAIERVSRLTADLAAARAWGECLTRTTAHQEQALKSYQEHISNLGKGTGKWAHRYALAARGAMVGARGAVPAWIMSMQTVIDTIPPDRDAFDVVIVDEASQSGIEALFLLWLAPRVIVVGDERQCAPSTIVRGGHQQIYDRLDDYLADVPEFLKMAFTPQANLFSLLSTRFSAAIKLREHFRCMPEIIKWSSGMFYKDKPLIPLRQFGGDRLPPLRTVYVPNAVDEGTSSTLRNHAEAEAIADRVVACLEDPAYDGLTFGVITLQGNAQARLIENMLLERIPADEYERRKLRVGSAPDFQGDQRNVIVLSMIVADRRSALTSREWQRRFNVAASRAKDQMWLFHSVTVDQLRPSDLRRSLLTYMLNPPAALRSARFDDLRWDSELRPPFESKFEQRVFIALRDRGYAVIPQYEINHRRIDLLVVGAKGQLAVECDGDFWHTSYEDQIKDLDRELELQRAGVRFWRIRESEFYLDPEAALAPLWQTLDARGIYPGDFVADRSPFSGDADPWEPPDLSDEEGLDGLDGENPDLLDAPAPIPERRATRVRPHAVADARSRATGREVAMRPSHPLGSRAEPRNPRVNRLQSRSSAVRALAEGGTSYREGQSMGGARSPAAEEQDHRVTLMRQAMSELQEIQRELVLIAERRGGKPLTEHIRDIQRRLRTLSSKIADLPDQGPFVSLKQHIRMVRGSADVIAASLAQGGDATTELNQLIGSIQDYDDDF